LAFVNDESNNSISDELVVLIYQQTPNGRHQVRAAGMPPTLRNGKLFGLPPSAAIAERVACMPGWAALAGDFYGLHYKPAVQ
jgi:hypothetical protein